MPRAPRLDYPGARHHVMNRGARKENVFLSDDHCMAFMTRLAVLPSRYGIRIHGYALMPNHFHLMLESQGNLSEGMRHLCTGFTQEINRVHGWDGPMFRGRFRNRVVESDAYWKHLLLYLHLNPVRANLAPTLDDSNWTSHDAYARGFRQEWLTTSELDALFGTPEAYSAAIQALRIGRAEAPSEFDAEALWRPPTTQPRALPPKTTRTEREAFTDLMAVTALPKQLILMRTRSRPGNAALWLTAWWLDRATPLAHSDIARVLGVSRGRVSQYCEQIITRSKVDPVVARWMAELDERTSDT